MNETKNVTAIQYIHNFRFPICVVDAESDLKIIAANQSFYDILGYSQEEMQFRFANNVMRFFDLNSMQKLTEFIRQIDQVNFINLDMSIFDKNKNEKFVYNEVSRCLDEPNLLFMCFTDITNFKNDQKNFQNLFEQSEYLKTKMNYETFLYNDKKQEIIFEHSYLLHLDLPSPFSIKQLFESDIIYPDDVETLTNAIQKGISLEKEFVVEFRGKHVSGKYRWFKVVANAFVHSDKQICYGAIEDISVQKELTTKYLNETQFYQAVMSVQDAYGQVDLEENRILKVGGLWSIYNELIDTVSFSDLFGEFKNKVVHPEDRAQYSDIMNRDSLISNYNSGISYIEGEFRRILEQNKMVWIKIHIHIFKNPLNSHYMALLYLKNINDQKRKELIYNFETESNVLNSSTIENSITQYLVNMPKNVICAFVILALKDLPEGNYQIETYLNQAVHLLSSEFRKNDMISRIDGNNFIIFLKDIISQEEFKARLDQLVTQLKEKYDVQIHYQMGITFAKAGQSFATVYRQASQALNFAMEQGEDHYYFFQRDAMIEHTDSKSFHTKNDSHTYVSFKTLEKEDLDTLVGEFGDMAYLIEPNTYDLLCANQAFYDRLGKLEEECLELKCYEVIHHRKTPCPFCAKANWSTERFYIYRNYNEILEQEFLIKNKLILWKGLQAVLAVAVDLSNNKNIIDSLENSTTENNYILSGIQHMQAADNLNDCMVNALENIGEFFRADRVRFWVMDNEKQHYDFHSVWSLENLKSKNDLTETQLKIIQDWLKTCDLSKIIDIDCQEALLRISYPMYQLMNEMKIHNQRWIPYKYEQKQILFMIDNISINFVNESFMESFTQFVFEEWNKRIMFEEAVYIQYHDRLTKALNRDCFEKKVAVVSRDKLQSMGAMVVNVNNFKIINEERGFDFGNHCLIELTAMMKKILGEDAVYRLSGDEFISLFTDCEQTEIEAKINQLKQMMLSNISFTISIGYAWDNVEKDLNHVIDLATRAMKANKKLFYDQVQVDKDSERLVALNGLLRSIANREFKVFLQPKLDNRINRLAGAEALIRYEHPEYGIVPPSKFIDAFENNNMIRYIDLFVFEEVCKTMERWKKEGRNLVPVSFNLSRMTIVEPDIVKTMDGIFSQYDISKELLEIEITENDTFIGKAILFQNAIRLHDAGFHISLDDFGTKHTNLNILSDIEVDVLKIDKSLINSLGINMKKQLIIKHVIQMCNDLNIEVIAEGVETKEQEDYLKQINCHLIQGYLYSKPIPIMEFEAKYLK